MMEWMENVTAEEALKGSFSNKSEEAEDEFKGIMSDLKSFIKSRSDQTSIRVLIKHSINYKHLRHLGFELHHLSGPLNVDKYSMWWH